VKALVIYWSKTGFTEKHAKWIAEELNADLISGKKVEEDMLNEYDMLVFGGSLHAVGINGAQFIKKNIDIIKDKKTAIFATGASPGRKEVIEEVKAKNFSREELSSFRFFYLRGGFDFNRLSFKDKMLMRLMKWKLNKKKKSSEKLTEDEQGMLDAFDNPVDFTDQNNIQELIDYLKS